MNGDERGGLPEGVARWLLAVMADGFVGYRCGRRADMPEALVAAYYWPDCVDLVVIRDFARITTARVPGRHEVDIFAPEIAVWAYEGDPEPALAALMDLAHPAHPDTPRVRFPAPRSLHVPRVDRRPMAVRLPAPGRSGVRAVRLGARIPRVG